MTEFAFDLHENGAVVRRDIAVTDVVIAGWTGRDPHKVREHIEELAALGVAPPPATPCFYRVGTETLTASPSADFLGAESSGEVEFVILVDDKGKWWVGLGSDHTDRKVETYSIAVSKQMCPKPVAVAFWAFDDVAPHWDSLELRSWVDDGDGSVLYQEGSVRAMLDPRTTASAYETQGLGQIGPGTLMFGGTFAAIGGIRPRRHFRMQLNDPVLGRTLEHEYSANWIAG